MLATARLQTIICTNRLDEARAFYETTLGLPLKGKRVASLVFAVGEGELLLAPRRDHVPPEHTVLGFAVEDVVAALHDLAVRGVTPERLAHLAHDAQGIVTAPDGARVAWIRDPDGHFLSIVQYAGAIAPPG